ncbi:MAG: IS4 family transposase, partial [Candidatus Methanoperedens sp.]|nr:IS4 family transposase [Candidatus Methanoperedens sp.]
MKKDKEPSTKKQSYEPDVIEKDLCTLLSKEYLKYAGKISGLIKREREIEAFVILWVLVFSFGVHLPRNLANMKRKYEKESKKKLAYSSWYERFTPELVEFLKLCVTHVIEQLALEQNKVLNEKLTKFKDVLIQDSTIIRLHKSLAKKWPAARSKTVAAGVKVGVLVSAVANSPKSIGIYPERTNELKTLRIGPWIKDRILLIDLGFYKHLLFSKIKQYGGSFVSRLKGNVNPLIIAAYNTCPGNSIDVKGKYLNEILPKLKGEVLDVEVEISFKRPNYNGKSKTRMDTERFRLVAVFNEDEKKYHIYLTDISPDVLGPKDIAKLYGARWDIELVFKELKSRYDLDVVNTKKPHIIEAYIWISILTLFISRRIYNIVRKHSPKEKMVRYTQLRWSTIFTENADAQLTLILRYCGVERTFETVMNVYQSQALDPHVNRHRFRE